MSTKSSKPVLGYILKGYPRISETFISNEILLLEKAGFRLHLFPMRQPRESFCHDSVKKIKAPVHYLPTELRYDFHRLLVPNILLAVKSPRRYRKTVAMAATRYRRSKSLATWKHLFQAGFLAQRHLGNHSDVNHLHGHFAHSPTSVTLFAASLSGLNFSFTAHAKDIYTSNKEQLQEKISLASFVFTCTKYNLAYLKNLVGTSQTPIHCVYHGIDIDLFQSKPNNISCQEPYELLTVARLTEKKGLPTIYKAIKIVKDKGLKLQHTLIGDGDEKDGITDLINALQLSDCCKLLGTRSHKEVVQQFEMSDLFVLGCQIAKNGDRDGIPNVLVESLAMGVPSISTQVSAIPEILRNGQTGITVPAEDPEKMAGAIMELLSDDVLRNKLKHNGRQFVEENFDNRKLILEMGDIFQNNAG